MIHNIRKYSFIYYSNQDLQKHSNIDRIILLFEIKKKVGRIVINPCQIGEIDYLISDYIKYDLCYYPEHIELNSKAPSNLKDIRKNVKFNEPQYLDLMHSERASIKTPLINILNESHAHIEHTIITITPYNYSINQLTKDEIYVLITQGDKHYGLFSNLPLAKGMYSELINKQVNTAKIDISLLSNGQLCGTVFVPAKIAQFFCTYLVTNLIGAQILSKQSFVDPTDIGKRIFTSHLCITDDPFYIEPNTYVDSEGTQLYQKQIVYDGILEDCLCDIITAAQLNCTAGNSFFNYSIDHLSIQPTYLHFSVRTNSTYRGKFDIYLQDINPYCFSYDHSSHMISCQFIGKDVNSGETKLYSMNEPLQFFFNSIITSTGEEQLINNLVLPDFILFFGG